MVAGMKFFPALFAYIQWHYSSRRHMMLLLRFGIILTVFVVVYSVLFHVFMAREGREFSWVTGVYWTLTTMSALGLGDITFSSDAGRIFYHLRPGIRARVSPRLTAIAVHGRAIGNPRTPRTPQRHDRACGSVPL